MTSIKVIRTYHPTFTSSTLKVDEEFFCFGLELPNKDNAPNVSCIAEGVYTYKVGTNSKGKPVLHVIGVPNRTSIQVHAGNYVSQIEGCLLVGDSIIDLDGIKVADIANSKITLNKLINSISTQGTIIFTNTYTQSTILL